MAYTGIYERTIFYNPVNKYSVISVKTSDRSIPEKARSAYRHRDNMIHFAAVGYELPRTDQVSMILDGEWKEGKNGFQLHVTKCEEVVPQTREGIKGYLSSRLIKGIGGKTAELIVDRFGADTLHVLENEPERLLEIRGVSKAKLEEIIASYNESRTLRDLMLLLAPFQITPTTATKIYDHFGAHSVDILRDNPFELCQISGFGFKRVDAIMRKNNWPLNSPMRIRGAVFAALEGAKGDGGHLYLEAEQLHKEAMSLLNSMIPVPQMRVKADDLEAVIDDMLLQGKIINSNGNYYLVKTFAQEDETARSIARLLCRPVERVDVQDLLTRVRRQLGVELSLRQTEAVHMVFRSDLSIITGSPGTGKTTVLKAVIEVFKLLKPSENTLLAAPTGRASRRMAESTGVNNASTLHSLLGLFGEDGGFRKEEEDMLDAGLIIVDESSMMDMWLARQFFSRIGPNTKVLLVGDADQLQSVGAGDVFRELIDCGLIPVTVLNEIFRQKKDSLIAYNAQKINNNDTGFFYGNDFTVCKCANQEEAAEHLRNLYLAQVKQYGVDRVQILSPFRSTGAASVDQLNEAIRELVNPQTEEADLKVGSLYFRVGDRVMQNKNSIKASNGDIGFIRSFRHDERDGMRISIQFSPTRVVEYSMEEMGHVELAYAKAGYDLTPWCNGYRPVFDRWKYNFTADMSGVLYQRNLSDTLKDTPWAYSQLEAFSGIASFSGVATFLSAYIKRPKIEHLIKMKLYRLVSGIIYGGYSYSALQAINFNGENMRAILGIDRPYFPLLRELNPSIDQLHLIRQLLQADHKPSTEQIKWFIASKISNADAAKELLAHMSVHKLQRYVEQQFAPEDEAALKRVDYYKMNTLITDYHDYLCMCKELQYDVKNSFILFPRELKAAHDSVAKTLKDKRTAEHEKAIAGSFDEWQKRYQYQSKELMMIPPHSAKEIVDEGAALHHCVRLYVKNVAEKKSVILFVRSVDEPDKSLCTVEVKDGQVTQARGFDNEEPPAQITAFIEQWKQRVLYASDKAAA